jgi:hypothetical protein
VPKKPLVFTSAESLAAWLSLKEPGQEILDRVLPEWLLLKTDALETEIRAEVDRRLARRARCLIVCHADGLIEAYGNQVSVHFADVPRGWRLIEAEAIMEEGLSPNVRKLVMQRSEIHWYDTRTAMPYPYMRDTTDLDQESTRLRIEAERREAIARKKYPNHQRLSPAV